MIPLAWCQKDALLTVHAYMSSLRLIEELVTNIDKHQLGDMTVCWDERELLERTANALMEMDISDDGGVQWEDPLDAFKSYISLMRWSCTDSGVPLEQNVQSKEILSSLMSKIDGQSDKRVFYDTVLDENMLLQFKMESTELSAVDEFESDDEFDDTQSGDLRLQSKMESVALSKSDDESDDESTLVSLTTKDIAYTLLFRFDDGSRLKLLHKDIRYNDDGSRKIRKSRKWKSSELVEVEQMSQLQERFKNLMAKEYLERHRANTIKKRKISATALQKLYTEQQNEFNVVKDQVSHSLKSLKDGWKPMDTVLLTQARLDTIRLLNENLEGILERRQDEEDEQICHAEFGELNRMARAFLDGDVPLHGNDGNNGNPITVAAMRLAYVLRFSCLKGGERDPDMFSGWREEFLGILEDVIMTEFSENEGALQAFAGDVARKEPFADRAGANRPASSELWDAKTTSELLLSLGDVTEEENPGGWFLQEECARSWLSLARQMNSEGLENSARPDDDFCELRGIELNSKLEEELKKLGEIVEPDSSFY